MQGIARDMDVLGKAIGLRAQRQQVLASNIANADTPNYKARDFDFRGAMQAALAGTSAGGALGLAQTAERHLQGAGGNGAPSLQYRRETQSAVDGNTVDMDVERAEITENAMQYEVLTRLISDRFQGMRAALANTSS